MISIFNYCFSHEVKLKPKKGEVFILKHMPTQKSGVSKKPDFFNCLDYDVSKFYIAYMVFILYLCSSSNTHVMNSFKMKQFFYMM